MSNAAPLSAPTPPPDASRAAARTAVPPGIAHLLYVVRFLIAYACDIAAKAELCAMQGDIGPVSVPFAKGILIQDLIIRVARGLRRALALQEMLLKRAAAGSDIEQSYRDPPSGSGGGRSKQSQAKPPKAEILPSVAEIAEEVLNRPPGAVIADICHDIGITPDDLTDEQWEALKGAVNEYGGSLMKLWPAMRNRLVTEMEALAADPEHAPMPVLPLIPWMRHAGPRRPWLDGAHPP